MEFSKSIGEIKEVAENRREDKIECSKETLDKIKSILNIEKKTWDKERLQIIKIQMN